MNSCELLTNESTSKVKALIQLGCIVGEAT